MVGVLNFRRQFIGTLRAYINILPAKRIFGYLGVCLPVPENIACKIKRLAE
jgi:hypothetical protein